MKIEFKDVAHLYLGCKSRCEIDDACIMGDGYNHLRKGQIFSMDERDLENYLHGNHFFKPVLRKLSDITNDEAVLAKESFNHAQIDRFASNKHFTPNQFIYLLSIGIDLFGLIESEQALIVQL